MQKLIFLGLLITPTLLNTFRCQASDNTLPHTLKRTAHMAELDTKLPQAKKQRVDNNSAILRAIANNDWTTVTLAIKSGAYNINLPFLIEKQEDREHLLRIAAFEGKTDLVQNLLETKVNVNAKTKLGCAILDTTLCGFEKHGNNSDAIKLLIQAGAQLTNPINYSQGKILVSILKSMFDEKEYAALASFLSKIDNEDDRIIKGYHILIEEALKHNYHEFITYLVALCTNLQITTPCAIKYISNALCNAKLYETTKKYGTIIQHLNNHAIQFSSYEEAMIMYLTKNFTNICSNKKNTIYAQHIGNITIPELQQPLDLFCLMRCSQEDESSPKLLITYKLHNCLTEQEIACIELEYTLHNMHIHHLFVDENYSKKGIGNLLVTKAIELAQALGCMQIDLLASPLMYHSNRNIEELAKWYRKFGFVGDQQEKDGDDQIIIPMLLALINLKLPEHVYSRICSCDATEKLALRLYNKK